MGRELPCTLQGTTWVASADASSTGYVILPEHNSTKPCPKYTKDSSLNWLAFQRHSQLPWGWGWGWTSPAVLIRRPISHPRFTWRYEICDGMGVSLLLVEFPCGEISHLPSLQIKHGRQGVPNSGTGILIGPAYAGSAILPRHSCHVRAKDTSYTGAHTQPLAGGRWTVAAYICVVFADKRMLPPPSGTECGNQVEAKSAPRDCLKYERHQEMLGMAKFNMGPPAIDLDTLQYSTWVQRYASVEDAGRSMHTRQTGSCT